MAKFLNTDLLNEWIPRLIAETERELVIIVPYIRTSDRIYQHLLAANKRGVETTLVYKENKLNEKEREKLKALTNLNLMHHPNVHAKCYYNEKYLIIGSMNLYEYSELNNREMGVLFCRTGDMKDDKVVFGDAIEEINSIITGATMEQQSHETKVEGFEMDIIKTDEEKTEELCKQINKYFIHKRFKPHQLSVVGEWVCLCKNYFDKIDVMLEGRIRIVLNKDGALLQERYQKKHKSNNEFMFKGFKFYWNTKSDCIYLYRNGKDAMWSKMTEAEEWEFTRTQIDACIGFVRGFM